MNTLNQTFLLLAFVTSVEAGTWIRLNHAGYTPDRSKQAIVLSDTDITHQVWTLSQNEKIILQGKLPSGTPGDQIHVAQAYSYPVDFTEITEEGVYTLSLKGAASQKVIIHSDPYSVLATQALMHLRAMRSGSDQARLHPASHLGDSVARVHTPHGDWKQGDWTLSEPQRTLDMRGGHYDAGDYIKFTLNESYLAWHLLRAYQENPALFTTLYHPTLPDILDEAQHSLDYLMRVHPDSNTFVIQVGDGNDHNQGWRLPQKDRLDGKRPALCALSRVHMGSAAAALALGAQVFMAFDANLANQYEKQAERIYLRARQNDTQRSAFERNATNDFYWDDTDPDNLALAATELFRLTHKAVYLEQAKAYAPRSGYEVSWAEWHFQANHRLALLGDASAKSRALNEVSRYESHNVWQVPGNYTWGTLHRWIGIANAHFRAQRDLQVTSQDSWLFWGVLDYVMGRNNWGMPLLASGNLPGSIKNIYNSLYRITGAFPTGALSEGPGDKATHLQMRAYFKLPEPNHFEEFNTESAVFYDNRDDFMIQEATIGGQGDLLYMLALASKKDIQPQPDSGNTTPSTALKPYSPYTPARVPTLLRLQKKGKLLYIHPQPQCHAESLHVTTLQGFIYQKLYRNAQGIFIWNTQNTAPGRYAIHPQPSGNALMVSVD